MEQEPIARTALDEMVQTDRNQLMKAMVPYLPPEGQRFISVYAKAQEFMNTMAVFSGNRPRPEMTAAALPNMEPVEMLNDLRRFCSDKRRIPNVPPSAPKRTGRRNLMSEDWKENPKLEGIDPQKLQLLQNLADQGLGKNPSQLLPFLMNAASQGQKAGLNFDQNEIGMILEVLKMGKSQAEIAKLDRIVSLMQMIRH